MGLSEEHKAKLREIESNLEERPFPPQVIIEVTSRCNFRCIHCAHKTMKRVKADMEVSLFHKIIDEIAAKAPQTEIWPAFYGEPFLLGERLFEYLRYAAERGCRNIFLNTNGSFLHDANVRREILASGIKSLMISLDAYSPEAFRNIRCGGSHDKIYSGIELLLKEKASAKQDNPVVICQFVQMDENAGEADQFSAYWIAQGADVKLRRIGSWTGAIDAPQLDQSTEFRIACPIGNNTFAVQQDGSVAACCADYSGGFRAGSLLTHTIEEIWRGPLFHQIREPFREHRWSDIPEVCKRCRDWQICGAEYHSRTTEHRAAYPFWHEK